MCDCTLGKPDLSHMNFDLFQTHHNTSLTLSVMAYKCTYIVKAKQTMSMVVCQYIVWVCIRVSDPLGKVSKYHYDYIS